MKKILSIILILILCLTILGCKKDSTKIIEDTTEEMIKQQHEEISKRQLNDMVDSCYYVIHKNYNLTDIEIDDVATLITKTAKGEMISQDEINQMSQESIITYYKWLGCIIKK